MGDIPEDKDFSVLKTSDDAATLYFHSPLNVDTAAGLLARLRSRFAKAPYRLVVADLGGVERFDDYGLLVLRCLQQIVEKRQGRLTVANAGGQIQPYLSDLEAAPPSPPAAPVQAPPTSRLVVRLGEWGLDRLRRARDMVTFLGSVILAAMETIAHPRAFRFNDTVHIMEKTGVNALPIVGLISLLLGLVIAFMSSIQLQQFGANIYVASLVGIAMVSELGPIMTAIVVAGRTGSAFAAEIGTMKISEEIDALFLMGFSPTRFLVIPRLAAAVVVIPILTLFSDIFGILGGLLVGVTLLDLTGGAYLTQTFKTVTLFEMIWGLSKSVVFAVLIAWVGCLRGFQTRGGADAVGNAATSAVVTSIFLIILVDSAFAIVRSYVG